MKTPCDHDQLLLFWSGECTEAEVERIQAHLVDCPACCARMDELRAMASRISDLPTPRSPRDFAGDAVTAAFKGGEYRFIWNDRTLLGVAAGLICVLGLSLLWSLQALSTVRNEISQPVPPPTVRPRILALGLTPGEQEEKALHERIRRLEHEVALLRVGQYQAFSTISHGVKDRFEGPSRLSELRTRTRLFRASLGTTSKEGA